ncbi:MAG: hypothetical protein; putative Arylesterase-related, partial [uncultured Thermomicrobiales bacterium]
DPQYSGPDRPRHDRPDPRAVGDPAQLGALGRPLPDLRPPRPRPGLPRPGGRGRGAARRPVADRGADGPCRRRALRAPHRSARPAADHHGPLLRRPDHPDPARPRLRRRGRGDRLGARRGRQGRPGLADPGQLPRAAQPGQSPPGRRVHPGAVPLRLHQHPLRRGVADGLRALPHSRAGQLRLGRRACQLHARPPGHLRRLPQRRPRAAAVHRGRRRQPHAAGGQRGQRQALPPVPGGHRVQGVPWPLALHAGSGRLGGGRRLRAGLGDRARRAPPASRGRRPQRDGRAL